MTLVRLRAPSRGRSVTASRRTVSGSWPASSARRRMRVSEAAPSSAASRARSWPVMVPSATSWSSQRPVRSVAARCAASANSSPAVRVLPASVADSVAVASAERGARAVVAGEDPGEHGDAGRGAGSGRWRAVGGVGGPGDGGDVGGVGLAAAGEPDVAGGAAGAGADDEVAGVDGEALGGVDGAGVGEREVARRRSRGAGPSRSPRTSAPSASRPWTGATVSEPSSPTAVTR